MSARAASWVKMGVAGAAMCIGGPALVWYVSPSEEELFKRYNPDLQRRSLENREQKQQDFDDFVNKLKEYSKSPRPIWDAAAEDEQRRQQQAKILALQRKKDADEKRLQDEIRKEALR